MAKQTFVTGNVLTAAQQNALQGNDYNQTVNTSTASYVLVATDVGTRRVMNAAGATTITVNTSLFAAGDTLYITNIGAGTCTVTAGTATVSSSGSLALLQYDSGTLYFTSTGVALFNGVGNVGDITGVTAGTGLSGGGASGSVSLAIDTAVTADLTTIQSLSNKTLTAPKISTLTTNGDILYGTGSSVITRLGIGSSAQVLTVTGGVPVWATPSSAITFSGVSCYKSAAGQSTANDTEVAITFDAEEFDTDSYHSTSSNTSRLTVPAGKTGYFLLVANIRWTSNTTGSRFVSFYKNAATVARQNRLMAVTEASSATWINATALVSATAGDYFECYAYQKSGGSLNVDASQTDTRFGCYFLGA